MSERPAAALVMHPDCGRHDTGWGHPEHQGRLPAVMSAIESDTPDLLGRVALHEATPASVESIARVHSDAHVRKIEEYAAQAARAGTPIVIAGDTAISAASWEAALASAGCANEAVRLVVTGAVTGAFALTRPPGHHATRHRAMGFCLFNNVAIAARSAQADHGVERVLIVDWDVHHGNGTQDIFWEDGSVYYVSLHQWPWYPGTGTASERGGGAGLGRTLNVPLPAGIERSAYLSAFRSAIKSTLAEFQPDLVLVSAGFDCMRGDPLGRLLLEPEDLHGMTRHLQNVSAAGRLVVLLEGGYNPPRVGSGVVDVLRALIGTEPKAEVPGI